MAAPTVSFPKFCPGLGIDVSFVDTSEIENVKRALRPETKMVFLETPANPTMTLCDIREIARNSQDTWSYLCCRQYFCNTLFPETSGARGRYLPEQLYKIHRRACRPSWWNSYRKKDFIKSMAQLSDTQEALWDSHEAWLCIRGLKTLHIRMERHAENAMKVAEFLESRPEIEWVQISGASKPSAV